MSQPELLDVTTGKNAQYQGPQHKVYTTNQRFRTFHMSENFNAPNFMYS